MGNTQFNHAVLERVAKSLMRSCGVRTRITCVFHRVNFKWAQCASPQPAPSHLEFALTLPHPPSPLPCSQRNGGEKRKTPFPKKTVDQPLRFRDRLCFSLARRSRNQNVVGTLRVP